MRVSGVSCESSLPPLSALSPTSFLFPSSDSGFVSLYSSSASLSSHPPSCVAPSASSSFTLLSSSGSASSFSLPPLSYPPRPSVLSSAVGVSAPPPPGFPPLPSSPSLSLSTLSFSPLVSSSFSSFLAPLSSSSSLSSSLLPSLVSFSSLSSAPVSSSPFVSSASSSLDYASYKAHVLGILDEYLSLARWYVSVGGSDFFSFLSSHCPHLSADTAKDFASGSSVLLSTLRSSSASVSDPPASAPAPGALPPSPFSFVIPPGGVASSRGLRGVAVPPAAPVSSAGFLSSSLSVVDSRSAPHPLLAPPLSSSALPPPSLSRSGGALGFAAVADPVSSAVPVVAPAVSSSLFRPFDAPSAVPPLSSLPPHGSSPLFGSAPLSGVPAAPLSSYFSSAAPSRSGPSFPDDSAFDPNFADPSAQDPELPLAPPVPDCPCGDQEDVLVCVGFVSVGCGFSFCSSSSSGFV